MAIRELTYGDFCGNWFRRKSRAELWDAYSKLLLRHEAVVARNKRLQKWKDECEACKKVDLDDIDAA